MPNPLRPSKNAVIYSLVDGEPYVGIPPTRPVTVPVSLYARDSVTEAPTVSDLASRYLISANGYKTQNQDGLITKENERGVGWIAPADNNEGQIRIGNLIMGPSFPPFYPSIQLFRFRYPPE